MFSTGFRRTDLNGNRRRDGVPSPVQSWRARAQNLRGKRRTAATASGGVRVLESEAGAHHTAHVVDLDAVEILSAEHVDKHPHAFFVKDEVAFARLLFDVQAVLKARAASGYDSHAEP